MIIVTNDFARRHTPESRFSHFDGSWETLEKMVVDRWEVAKPGYRTGVLLIQVPPEGFYSSVVTLKDGDELTGTYSPRRPGEAPRKSIGVTSRNKTPAARVEIVLYSSAVLAETGDNSLFPSDKKDNWEIISINASPTIYDEPINPWALLHNHFGSSGGTTTNLSDSELVEMLRDIFVYWKDKAMCTESK